MATSYLDHRLGHFVDLVAAREAAPGGGPVAAVTVSLAAGLVAMAARYSVDELVGAEQMLDDAERLRGRAAGLADTDARAYQAVLAAFASTRDSDPDDRSEQLRVALEGAAQVPLEIAETGAETAQLAALLAVEGNRSVRGDAATALLLAEAAVRSAAHLVTVDVAEGGCDQELVRRARASVDVARRAVHGAREALFPGSEP